MKRLNKQEQSYVACPWFKFYWLRIQMILCCGFTSDFWLASSSTLLFFTSIFRFSRSENVQIRFDRCQLCTQWAKFSLPSLWSGANLLDLLDFLAKMLMNSTARPTGLILLVLLQMGRQRMASVKWKYRCLVDYRERQVATQTANLLRKEMILMSSQFLSLRLLLQLTSSATLGDYTVCVYMLTHDRLLIYLISQSKQAIFSLKSQVSSQHTCFCFYSQSYAYLSSFTRWVINLNIFLLSGKDKSSLPSQKYVFPQSTKLASFFSSSSSIFILAK